MSNTDTIVGPFYFTFGGGSPFCSHYIEVQTDDYTEARELMFSIFDGHWSFQYFLDEFRDQPAHYGMNMLCSLRKNAQGHFRPCEPSGLVNP